MRRLYRYAKRLTVVFPESPPFPQDPVKAVLTASRVVGNNLSPVRELHRRCYQRHANPLLFSRIPILLLAKNTVLRQISHNMSISHPP